MLKTGGCRNDGGVDMGALQLPQSAPLTALSQRGLYFFKQFPTNETLCPPYRGRKAKEPSGGSCPYFRFSG